MKAILFIMAVVCYGQSTFDFVGTTCSAGTVSLNTFGQKIVLTAPAALALVQSRCPIIPDAQFQTVGFTAVELQVYGPIPYAGPQEFQQKVQAARALWVTYYNSTISGILGLSGATTLACTLNTACSTTFAASGGTAPYAWTISAGTLPAGIALDPAAGTLGGTPTVAGSATVSVTVTDTASNTLTQSVTISVTSTQVLAQVPNMYTETAAIDPNTPSDVTTMNYTLGRTIAPNTLLLSILNSSMIGWNTTLVSVPAGLHPEQLIITLPTYRPFTSGDSFTFVYWSLQ